MEMTVWNEGKRLSVKLSGEIDHHEAKEIREKLDRLIMENRPKVLVVNLGGINFMDSSGLGLLLGRYRIMKACGGEMFINEPTARVMKILAMAGVDKLIRVI